MQTVVVRDLLVDDDHAIIAGLDPMSRDDPRHVHGLFGRRADQLRKDAGFLRPLPLLQNADRVREEHLGFFYLGHLVSNRYRAINPLDSFEFDGDIIIAPRKFRVERRVDRSVQCHEHQEHRARDDEHQLGQDQAPFAPECVRQRGGIMRWQQESAHALYKLIEPTRAEIRTQAVTRHRLAHADGRAVQDRPQRGEQRHGERRE